MRESQITTHIIRVKHLLNTVDEINFEEKEIEIKKYLIDIAVQDFGEKTPQKFKQLEELISLNNQLIEKFERMKNSISKSGSTAIQEREKIKAFYDQA